MKARLLVIATLLAATVFLNSSLAAAGDAVGGCGAGVGTVSTSTLPLPPRYPLALTWIPGSLRIPQWGYGVARLRVANLGLSSFVVTSCTLRIILLDGTEYAGWCSISSFTVKGFSTYDVYPFSMYPDGLPVGMSFWIFTIVGTVNGIPRSSMPGRMTIIVTAPSPP